MTDNDLITRMRTEPPIISERDVRQYCETIGLRLEPWQVTLVAKLYGPGDRSSNSYASWSGRRWGRLVCLRVAAEMLTDRLRQNSRRPASLDARGAQTMAASPETIAERRFHQSEQLRAAYEAHAYEAHATEAPDIGRSPLHQLDDVIRQEDDGHDLDLDIDTWVQTWTL